MNCITAWCKNTTFTAWYAPAGYATNSYKGETFHRCTQCGAKWRDRADAVIAGVAKPRLRELSEAMREYRTRTDNAAFEGRTAGYRGKD